MGEMINVTLVSQIHFRSEAVTRMALARQSGPPIERKECQKRYCEESRRDTPRGQHVQSAKLYSSKFPKSFLRKVISVI